MSGFRLGVDFGTSTTAAVLRRPDGAVRSLIVDGSELMPSAVCRDPSGVLLTGRDALHAGRSFPDGLELNPKRCVDDGVVLLGGAEIPVVDLFVAVLRRVGDEARRAAGGRLSGATITCPVGWGSGRRQVLVAAASAAGLDPVVVVREPVAAAVRFLRTGDLRIGGHLLVYDLGAGTFDASVVRRTPDGFDIIADRGLPDTGGLDIDAAVVDHLGAAYAARDPGRWERLMRPATDADRRAARQFRDDVRTAKEMLSRTASTTVAVPLFDDTAPLGREELDRLALPVLERTIAAAHSVLDDARVPRPDRVLLVGGASRTPLAATLLHRAFGVAPTVLDMPELVVAEGSVDAQPLADLAATESGLGPLPVPVPPTVSLVKSAPLTSSPRTGDRDHRGRRAFLAAAAGTLVLGAAATWRLAVTGRTGGGARRAAVVAGATLTGHTDRIQAVAFSGDGRLLASTGDDRTIRIWDPVTGDAVATFGPDFENASSAQIALDETGGRVAVRYDGTQGPRIQVWDVASGRIESTLTGAVAVTSMQFVPRSDTLVSVHDDGQIRLWVVREDGGLWTTLGTGARFAERVELSPDGRQLVAGVHYATSPERVTVQLWELATHTMTRNIEGYRDGGISPGSTMLALTTIDGALHRCDLATGAITPLSTDKLGASAAFVSDELIVRTMQANRGRPQLWDPVDRRMVAEIPGDGPVAVRPGSGQVAALTPDRRAITVWTTTEA
ncbi:Hsp70 family protein [Virgisporangium aurantiacum]|uniref:Hsp70 family protein n=1 Tax=Virgisporangium aurantiacum TaxID=175570 RepID=UPI001950DF5B|nr:Hsp70 family protein [Virgisporangium aurantiacum]